MIRKCPECDSAMVWRESLGVLHCNKCEMDWSNTIMTLCAKVRNAALREAAEVAHQIEWDSLKSILHLIGDEKNTRIQQAILSLIYRKEEKR